MSAGGADSTHSTDRLDGRRAAALGESAADVGEQGIGDWRVRHNFLVEWHISWLSGTN